MRDCYVTIGRVIIINQFQYQKIAILAIATTLSLIVVDTFSIQETSAKECASNDNKNNNENNNSNDDRTIRANQQHSKDRVYIATIKEDSTPFRLPAPFP